MKTLFMLILFMNISYGANPPYAVPDDFTKEDAPPVMGLIVTDIYRWLNRIKRNMVDLEDAIKTEIPSVMSSYQIYTAGGTVESDLDDLNNRVSQIEQTPTLTEHDQLGGRNLNSNHPHFLLIDGTRPMTGNFNLNNYYMNLGNGQNIGGAISNLYVSSASWADSAPGDNLGNHTATTNLIMSGRNILRISSLTATNDEWKIRFTTGTHSDGLISSIFFNGLSRFYDVAYFHPSGVKTNFISGATGNEVYVNSNLILSDFNLNMGNGNILTTKTQNIKVSSAVFSDFANNSGALQGSSSDAFASTDNARVNYLTVNYNATIGQSLTGGHVTANTFLQADTMIPRTANYVTIGDSGITSEIRTDRILSRGSNHIDFKGTGITVSSVTTGEIVATKLITPSIISNAGNNQIDFVYSDIVRVNSINDAPNRSGYANFPYYIGRYMYDSYEKERIRFVPEQPTTFDYAVKFSSHTELYKKVSPHPADAPQGSMYFNTTTFEVFVQTSTTLSTGWRALDWKP